MAWFRYMLLMENDLLRIINSLFRDIEDASPNLKNKLNEIYPIKFKLELVGHKDIYFDLDHNKNCLLYTSPSPRDRTRSRMPSSA